MLAKLNRTKFLISRTLIDLNISLDEFALIKECDDMKKEIKSLKTYTVYQRF